MTEATLGYFVSGAMKYWTTEVKQVKNKAMKSLKIKKRVPLEKEIQLACCQYLELRRHFFWRQNTAPIYDTTRKAFRAMPKYSLPGVPDIIVITDGGFVVFLEIKRPKAKQSPDQIVFENMCKKVGAEYWVVTDVSQLKSLGL